MRRRIQFRTCATLKYLCSVVAIGISLVAWGCQGQTAVEKTGSKSRSEPLASSKTTKLKPDKETKAAAGAAGEGSQPIEETGPPEMPPVIMSETHAATCLVKVGDTLPDVTLADLEGKRQSLHALFGDRATVVFFWSSEDIYTVAELEDMAADAESYATRGVGVVGINLKEPVEKAKKTAEEAGAHFPILLDEDGAYYARISTGPLPHTYLVDKTGKALWLDIEYSRETSRLLEQAIQAAVAEN